jgi:hypothetical protein
MAWADAIIEGRHEGKVHGIQELGVAWVLLCPWILRMPFPWHPQLTGLLKSLLPYLFSSLL